MVNLSDPNTYIDARGKFQCIECGKCCTLVANLLSLPPGLLAEMGVQPFPPHYLNEKRQCIHLDTDMKCKIYAARPGICRIPPGQSDAELAQDCANLQGLTVP